MQTVFIKILEMSLEAGIFVLALIVFRPVLLKIPAWIRCVLWGMVGLRLVSPFSFNSMFSLIPDWSSIVEGRIFRGMGVNGADSITVFTADYGAITNLPKTAEKLNESSFGLINVVSIIWIAGILLFIVYVIIRTAALIKKVAPSINIGDNVFICDEIGTPFIIGVFRKKIYLPSGLDSETATHVINHENAHIKRLDPFWKLAGFIILIVNWFNPLIWIAYLLMCGDMEIACDEKVIKNYTDSQKAMYSQALLKCSLNMRNKIVSPVMFGGTAVKSRIRKVLNYRNPSLIVLIFSILICVLLSLFFMTNADNSMNKGFIKYVGINRPVNITAYGTLERTIDKRDENGNIVSRYKCIYTDEGNLLEKIETDNKGNVISRREYSLSENGWISSVNEYDGDGNLLTKSEYTRDEKGREISCKSFYPDNSFCWWNEYEYDSEGNAVRYIRYNEDGSVNCVWKSRYDNKGLEKMRVCYNSSGVEMWTQLFTYDTKGNLKYSEEYSPDGKLKSFSDYELQ